MHKVALALLCAGSIATQSMAMDRGDADALQVSSKLALEQLQFISESDEGRIELPNVVERPHEASVTHIHALSLEDARARARSKSYKLGASESKAQTALELARAAYSGVLPSLDLRVSRGNETSTPSSRIDEATGRPLATSSQRREESYVVLRQPLFDPAATAEIRRTDAVRRAAESDEGAVRGDVDYELVEAFFGAVESSLTLKLAREQQQRMQRLWMWVSGRADAGGASGADRERIRARTLATQLSILDAAARVNQSLVTLSRLTGAEPGSILLPTSIGDIGVETVNDALSLIPDGNHAVARAKAYQEGAREEQRAQLARFAPTVNAELSNTRIKNSGGIAGWKSDSRAMFVLNVPIFSGGADYFRQRAAVAKATQYEYERMDAERDAQVRVQIAFSGLASARQKIESLRQQAASQAKVVVAFDQQLTAANRSLLDVFDAYQQYHQSQLDLVQVSVQAILLQYQILRATGRLGAPDELQQEGG